MAIIIKKRNMLKNFSIDAALLYVLGLFSTFQIIEIGGLTVFTLLFIPCMFLLFVRIRKISIYSKWFIIYFLSLFLSLFIEIIFIENYGLTNGKLWEKSSISGVIILIALFFSFEYLVKNSEAKRQYFFVGLYHSCLIQLIWGYLQFIVYHAFGKNINEIIFVDIFHMWNGVTQTNNGQLIITGLHVNAGLLAPVLIYLFFTTKNIWLKSLTLLLCIIVGSSTLLLCAIMLIVLSFFRSSLSTTIKYRTMIIIISITMVIITVFISNSNLVDRIIDIYQRLFYRLQSAKIGSFTDGSTFAHARYYTSIPFIFSKIDLRNLIFGFGPKCGGIPFVIYFNQYPNTVYGTESDVISTLYGVGLLGITILYGLFIYIAIKGKKLDDTYFYFMVAIMFAGIFYSIQLNWILLVEWTMLLKIKQRGKFSEIFITRLVNNNDER